MAFASVIAFSKKSVMLTQFGSVLDNNKSQRIVKNLANEVAQKGKPL